MNRSLVWVLLLSISCSKDEPTPIPETKKEVAMVLSEAQNLGFYDATVTLNIETNQNEVFDYGLVWGTSSLATTNGTSKINKGPCSKNCWTKEVMTGLSDGTKYFYRAFVITSAGISYSNELEFITKKLQWEQLANFPGSGRMLGIAFSIGDKGYLGLGMGPGNNFLNDFWEFNSKTGQWTRKADFPGGIRIDAVGFAINDKGYVGTGLNGDYNGTSDFWEYDPSSDTWTRKADYIGGTLEFAVGFAVGDKGYVGIGTRRTASEPLVNEFYEYSPATNEWKIRAPFPGTPADKRFTFVIDGKAYVGIGQLPLGGKNSEFWQYDPDLDVWTAKKNFAGEARYYSTGFALDGKGYTCAGRYGENEVMEYDPFFNEWQRMPTFLGTPREGLSNFVIGNKAFVGVGSTGFEYLNDMWVFQSGD